MSNIITINQSIREMQYNQWGKFKKLDFILHHHSTVHDDANKTCGHYGVSVYKFESCKLNYQFNDFIAKCILSDDDIYGLYRMYDISKHHKINNLSDFDLYIRNFYSYNTNNLIPEKQHIKQGYTFGDNNQRIIFIEFDTVYVMYECFGS